MMTQPTRNPGYWPTAALVLLALCPGLINSTALGLLSPTIAASLGTSPTDVSWVALLGNAAYPLGALLAADLTQRFPTRRLFLAGLGLFTASSLACAAAPDLSLLIAARILQGFAGGLLSIVAIPPLVLGYPARRLPISIVLLVMGLFGAATLGPIVGGVVEQTETWRWLFVLNGVLGCLAFLLARVVLAPTPAPNPGLRLDLPALLLACCGIALLFYGIGELNYHNWDAATVYGPVALGVGALVALIAVEYVQGEPLMPVRYLAHPLPISGAAISCIGAVAFYGLFSVLPAFLEAVRGLGAQDTGFHLWATVLGAVAGAVVVGVFFLTRWLPLLAAGSLFLLALAALLLTGLTTTTGDGTISLVAGLLGLGAALSIVPGLFLAALNMPSAALVGRSLALVTLLRYALQYAAGPALIHAIGTQTSIHYADLAAEVGAAPSSFAALLAQLTQRFTLQGQPAAQAHTLALQSIIADLMRQGQVLGTNDIAGLVLVSTVLGAAGVGVTLLALAGRRTLPTIADVFAAMTAHR
jgi:MFS family permease